MHHLHGFKTCSCRSIGRHVFYREVGETRVGWGVVLAESAGCGFGRGVEVKGQDRVCEIQKKLLLAETSSKSCDCRRICLSIEHIQTMELTTRAIEIDKTYWHG